MTPVHPQFLKQITEEIARLRLALEGVKDWAARSGFSGLEQWCSEALSPTGALAVFPVPGNRPHSDALQRILAETWLAGVASRPEPDEEGRHARILRAELTVLAETPSSEPGLCYCACCCQTPAGYRADDERRECTCKVPAPDLDPRDSEITRLLVEKKFVQETADATVKALADALAGTAPVIGTDGPCWCDPMMEKKNRRHWEAGCISRRSALKLAGR